eukprot:884463-Rhodomonas_salina.1
MPLHDSPLIGAPIPNQNKPAASDTRRVSASKIDTVVPVSSPVTSQDDAARPNWMHRRSANGRTVNVMQEQLVALSLAA